MDPEHGCWSSNPDLHLGQLFIYHLTINEEATMSAIKVIIVVNCSSKDSL